MNVIYVDDDVDDLDLFTEAFRQVNIPTKLHTSKTCQELKSFLSESGVAPSFIFIDVNMPRVDGYQCARVVRSFSEAPIIMISTNFNPQRQLDLKVANVSFMIKSTSIDEMVEV